MKTNKKLLRDGAIALGFGMLAGPALAQGTPGSNCDPLTGVCTTDGGGDTTINADASASATAAANVNFRDRLQAPGMGVYTGSAPGVYNGGALPNNVMQCVADVFRYSQSNAGAGVSASIPGFGFGVAGSSEGESRNELRRILDDNEIQYTTDAEGNIIGSSLPPVLQNTIGYCGSVAQMTTDSRVEAEKEILIITGQIDTFLATLDDRTSCERRQMNQDIATRIMGLQVKLQECGAPEPLASSTSEDVIAENDPIDDTAGLPTGYTNEFEKGHLCADGEGGLVEPSNGRFVNAETGREQTGEYCRRQLPGYRLD
ncbi:MAG: hypothetical protein CMH32_03425 [Micavibrio sp.]|mgnify:CR=1 FL=1|nr:hypothetical protein [Micavibrio sp.]